MCPLYSESIPERHALESCYGLEMRATGDRNEGLDRKIPCCLIVMPGTANVASKINKGRWEIDLCKVWARIRFELKGWGFTICLPSSISVFARMVQFIIATLLP
jgi:hypothetical protein